MAILDIFKKKRAGVPSKKPSPKKETEGGIRDKKEKTDSRALKESEKKEISKPKKKIFPRLYGILSAPHITEKATAMSEEDRYVFRVLKTANKVEVKEAVEGSYGVDVNNVRIINIPRKKRRIGRRIGWRKGYKKAIVAVKKGQKIEILPR